MDCFAEGTNIDWNQRAFVICNNSPSYNIGVFPSTGAESIRASSHLPSHRALSTCTSSYEKARSLRWLQALHATAHGLKPVRSWKICPQVEKTTVGGIDIKLRNIQREGFTHNPYSSLPALAKRTAMAYYYNTLAQAHFRPL